MLQPYTETPKRAALVLSQQDVSRLLSEKSPLARIDVMQKVALQYSDQVFDERNAAIAEQIFRLLVKDTELQVRIALAQSIKEDPSIPRDIVLNLSNDVREVAIPIIQYSEVLSDADLISIIRRSAEVDRLVAVAQRKEVSQMVVTGLVETNESRVVSTLVENTGAEINERTFQTIINNHKDDQDVLGSLVSRGGLPVTVVEKLITRVSSDLAHILKKKYPIEDAQLRQESDRSRELATLRLTEGHISALEVDKLVAQLHTFDRLTPSIILTSLCRGNLAFFESALAKLSQIPTQNARVLINDRGDLGFKALYDKSGLPDSMYRAARIVLNSVLELAEEGVRPGNVHYANRLVERIFSATSSMPPVENLSYIIALIRQNSIV